MHHVPICRSSKRMYASNNIQDSEYHCEANCKQQNSESWRTLDELEDTGPVALANNVEKRKARENPPRVPVAMLAPTTRIALSSRT